MDGDVQTIGQAGDITTAKAWRKVKRESDVVSPLSVRLCLPRLTPLNSGMTQNEFNDDVKALKSGEAVKSSRGKTFLKSDLIWLV
jgi:hypothetical protein